jgi:hypothetical protein
MAFMDEKRCFMDQNCYLWMRMALVDASFMGGVGDTAAMGQGICLSIMQQGKRIAGISIFAVKREHNSQLNHES